MKSLIAGVKYGNSDMPGSGTSNVQGDSWVEENLIIFVLETMASDVWFWVLEMLLEMSWVALALIVCSMVVDFRIVVFEFEEFASSIVMSWFKFSILSGFRVHWHWWLLNLGWRVRVIEAPFGSKLLLSRNVIGWPVEIAMAMNSSKGWQFKFKAANADLKKWMNI